MTKEMIELIKAIEEFLATSDLARPNQLSLAVDELTRATSYNLEMEENGEPILYLYEKAAGEVWEQHVTFTKPDEKAFHIRNLIPLYPKKESAEPAAYFFELATVLTRGEGNVPVYSAFEPRLTLNKPEVPEGAIRDLIPLYPFAVPVINAQYETVDNGIIGSTEAQIKRVERQDDNSLTVVIDGWASGPALPLAPSPNVFRMERAIRDLLEIGKRDTTNPKYDGYWEELKQSILPSPVPGVWPSSAAPGGNNRWFMNSAAFITLLSRYPMIWIEHSNLKYINFRIDTRDGGFTFSGRDGEQLEIEYILAAMKDYKYTGDYRKRS